MFSLICMDLFSNRIFIKTHTCAYINTDFTTCANSKIKFIANIIDFSVT